MLKTVSRTKLRDVVAARLKTFIAARNLQPGDRLPTETELAERFGVSRLSLREATKSLEFLGIVEARPGRGLTVGRVNMRRVTEYLGFHPALHDISPAELIDTRILIEIGVLPHVAVRMQVDDTIYPALSAINDELRAASSVDQCVELDIDFHRELILASGLSSLAAFGDVLAVFFQRFRGSVDEAEWQRGTVGHQRVLDGLEAGRVDEASEVLRAHIESHRQRMRASS